MNQVSRTLINNVVIGDKQDTVLGESVRIDMYRNALSDGELTISGRIGAGTEAKSPYEFSGWVTIEASLAEEPGKGDWFALPINEKGLYGADICKWTFEGADRVNAMAKLSGRFLWMRAEVSKPYSMVNNVRSYRNGKGSVADVKVLG